MGLRSLAEVRAQGGQRWFNPALDRLKSLPTEADSRLREFFSAGAPLYLARAPARLDVMGGIADYSGATVLELPLERATWALLQRQAAPRYSLATCREGNWHFVDLELPRSRNGALASPESLREWLAGRDADRWAAYPIGIVQYALQQLGPAAPPGGGASGSCSTRRCPKAKGLLPPRRSRSPP